MFRHQCPHPYHQTKRRRFVERGVLLVVVVSWVLFFTWGRYSFKSVEAYRIENAQLQQSVVTLTRENKELVKQQDFTESAHKIDLQAEKNSRNSLLKLHDELSDVKEQLAFYQHVVAPETVVKGLHISSLEVKQLPADSYQFQLVLAQGASQKRAVKGHYQLQVVVMFDGKEEAVPVVEGDAASFSFRYYQILTEEATIPSGFTPLRVELTVTPAVKQKEPITQEWLWADVMTVD